jgi:TPP-dependent 2-oxoacid decarboxylase
MLMTTYAVGELSALNGVMGAKAERSCVFHVVGKRQCAASASGRSFTTR